jgi:hypothetical protein
MKTLLSICAALAMALGATAMRAADITGNWSAEMNMPDGNSMPLTFTFKQDGAKLSGTVQSQQGGTMDISNGKIDGAKFTFDVSFNGMMIHHDCTVVNDDEIKMTTKADSGDFPAMDLTLQRVKQTPPATGNPAAPAKPTQPPQ